MELFSKIEDAVAIVRYPKGVVKQVGMYRRGAQVFVPHAGGFIRLVHMFDGVHSTSHPDIKVIDFEADGVTVVKSVATFNMGKDQ
jgi:hypothetical protein